MKDLTLNQIEEVSGGMNDWTAGGIAVIAIGVGGTVATGGFGLLVGGAMLVIGHYASK